VVLNLFQCGSFEHLRKAVDPVLRGACKCKPTILHTASEFIELLVYYPKATEPRVKTPALSKPNSMF
jgi:hypothetical protein